MALNSTFTLDLAIGLCFLIILETKFSPNNVQYPNVDLQSTPKPTQFALVYALKLNFIHLLKRIPFFKSEF